MKTINQINGRIHRNETIQKYFELGVDKWAHDTWQNRSYNFIFGERKSNQSVTGTFIYGAAIKELQLLTGSDGNYNYDRDNKRMTYKVDYNNRSLYFDVIANVDINGITLVIQNTNFKPAEKFKRYLIRSNETWQNFDLNTYFENKILPEYLYAPGLFRNMQIIYGIDKKEVPAKYKWMRGIFNQPTEIDIQKAWRQLFKKRFNVILSDCFNDTKINRMLNTFTWNKTRSKAVNSPSIMELYDHCSSVSDTDNGMISEFWNVINEYDKNTILI